MNRMIFIFLVFICLFLAGFNSFGQQIGFLCDKAELFRKNQQIDSADFYINQAISIAKTNSPQSLSRVYKIKGLILQDSLNYKGAIEYYFLAQKTSKNNNDTVGIGEAYNDIGSGYYRQEEYDSALKYFNLSAETKVLTSDSIGAGRGFNNTGIMHDILGRPAEAVKYYIKALKIYEAKKDSSLLVGTLLNVGLVYMTQKNYSKMYDTYSRSAKIAINIGDTISLINSYNSIGISKDETKDFDSANYFYQKALILSEKINHKYFTALTLTNIATNLSYVGKYEESIAVNSKAIKLKEELGYKGSLAISLIGLAETQKLLGKNNDALLSIKKALALSEEINYVEYIKSSKSIIHDLYHLQGDDKMAYKYLSEYVSLNDSLLNEENTKIINELNTKYDTEKKDSEIAILTKDQQLSAVELKRKKTVITAISIGLMLVLALGLVVLKGYAQKKKTNAQLTIKNEQIILQRDEIMEQKKELTDSIEYAQALQEAILPPREEIIKSLPDHFVLFKPKDVVSGDFYWFAQHNNKTFIAAIDCTGHGVPGAFVSMIGYNLLNQIVLEKNMVSPGSILSNLSVNVKDAFSRKGSLAGRNDGMDMVLCVMDKEKNTLTFSGANNPLFFIRNNELQTIKGDSKAIGGHTENDYVFQENLISLEPNDIFYLSSDGYYDQFGGDKGKKFMTKNFKTLLLEIHLQSFEQQKQVLEQTMNRWRGNLEQIDDICVIGFKID